jgi:hypothetical protein
MPWYDTDMRVEKLIVQGDAIEEIARLLVETAEELVAGVESR